jgi:bacterioferritin-associated ferredoxin
MYICICHAVTDTDIRDAVDNGVSSFSELSFKTGCSTQCGSCLSRAREVMDKALQAKGMPVSGFNLRVVSSN